MSGSLARAFDRKRLIADSRGFADVSLAFGQAVAAGQQSGSASPQMLSALSQWQQDAQSARARVAALPDRVDGRDLAVDALQKLSDALVALASALSLSDAGESRAAFARALKQLDAYHAVAVKLGGRLR